MEYPKRKTVRLKGYDYSSVGAYFITICTHDREYLFGNINFGSLYEHETQSQQIIPQYMLDYPLDTFPYMELSRSGNILNGVIKSLDEKFTYVTIESHVIMPNHLHVIILINNIDSDEWERAIHESPLQQEKRSVISNVTGFLKASVSKEIHLSEPDIKNIWQRSFHDRIIRNDREYAKILDYIINNPLRWHEDCFYNG